MMPSLTQPYLRPQYQQLQAESSSQMNCASPLDVASKLPSTLCEPIRSVPQQIRLQTRLAYNDLLPTQQQAMQADLQEVLKTCLDTRNPKLSTDNIDWAQVDNRLGKNSQFGATDSYESVLIWFAYGYGQHDQNSIFDDKLLQAHTIVNQQQLTTIAQVKETWIALARLYLVHPKSEHKFFSAHEGVTWAGSHENFNEHSKQHNALLVRSVEICRQGIFSLQKLKTQILDHKTCAAIDEAIADLLMQEAQGCSAHQKIDCNSRYSAASQRLICASDVYAHLANQCETMSEKMKLQEKLANALVLTGCSSYEHQSSFIYKKRESGVKQLEPVDQLTWSKDLTRTAFDSLTGKHHMTHLSFSEHCFSEAALVLQSMIEQPSHQPEDWLRLHCKYASALIKQGLIMPLYNEPNTEILSTIEQELRTIQKYFLEYKSLLTPKDQVRTMTKIADMKYAAATQRPDWDQGGCLPAQHITKLLKQKQATILANRAYSIMKKNGGAEAMPQEAHFLQRRSSRSPHFKSQFNGRPYAATAASLYEFNQQWQPKMHLREADWISGQSVMHT